jgi:RimJ/RimL family protein N-acetyltransferase
VTTVPAAIETERLLLRKPRPEDAADLAVAYTDPETVRYIGDGSTATLADVEAGIEQWLRRWDDWDLGFFSLERREDARVLGRAGFLRWDPETWEIGGAEVELGWLLAREHWGSGYATEAALALRDWAVAERGLTRLISLVQHGNVRSVRVAKTVGERFERDVEVRGKPSWLYALQR